MLLVQDHICPLREKNVQHGYLFESGLSVISRQVVRSRPSVIRADSVCSGYAVLMGSMRLFEV